MKSSRIYVFLFSFFGIVSLVNAQKPDKTLWYKEAGKDFNSSLVLGNGRMGASILGGAVDDKIYLNDATLWSGEPVDANKYAGMYKHLAPVREALAKENYASANGLTKKLQGKDQQSYMALGTLLLHFTHDSVAKNYYRELNLDSAVSKVRYTVNNVNFTREYFVSNPAKVMIIRLKSDKKSALNFTADFSSFMTFTKQAKGNQLSIDGYAPYYQKKVTAAVPDSCLFDPNRGTRFST